MIASTSNAKVKRLANLMKKKKARDEEKVYLVEGIRMFREVPKEDLLEVYASESFYKKEEAVVRKILEGTSVKEELLTDTVYAHVSDTKTPQGILCVVKQKDYKLPELLENGEPRTQLMILEHLQDPGNLGTIFRTAEAAGVTGILMDKGCVDIYNPKTIRSTMGAIYRVPFLYTEELHKTMKELQNRGVKIYAAHLEDSVDYDVPDYTQATAFLIGNEGNGLTRETADLADQYIKIPMQGQVESLNAAVAATVLMFEAARQRRR